MTNVETASSAEGDVSERTAAEHDALLAAIHQLERALAAPAPGREREWARQVAATLDATRQQIEEHRRSAEAEDGLLVELQRALPEAAYRIDKLKEAHGAFIEETNGLLRDVEQLATSGHGSADAIRRRAAALLSELRHHQARQVDLIYEAFNRDIGAIDP